MKEPPAVQEEENYANQISNEHAAPKLDVADTKPDGDDVFNKLTSEKAQGQGKLCDSKEVSKPVDPGITMDSTVKKENYNQIDEVNQDNDFKEEAPAIIFFSLSLPNKCLNYVLYYVLDALKLSSNTSSVTSFLSPNICSIKSFDFPGNQ